VITRRVITRTGFKRVSQSADNKSSALFFSTMSMFSKSYLTVAFQILAKISKYEGTDNPDDELTEYLNSDDKSGNNDMIVPMSKKWILRLLCESEFIKYAINDRGIFPFRITWKGLQFLYCYRQITNNETIPLTECSDEDSRLLFLFT